MRRARAWLCPLVIVAALAGCCGPDDEACTEAQNQALGAVMSSGGFYPAPQPRPVVNTSCTRVGNTVSCTSF